MQLLISLDRTSTGFIILTEATWLLPDGLTYEDNSTFQIVLGLVMAALRYLVYPSNLLGRQAMWEATGEEIERLVEMN